MIVIGDPVFIGIPQAYYGWIRNTDLELRCVSVGWVGAECSFVTDEAVCLPNVGCFVRPY